MTAEDHRLAALCFADIAGYTELSTRNEGQAVALVRLLQDVARGSVEERRGRVVKFIGDAVLAEFPSTDAAVRSGIELRDRFAAEARSRGLGSRDLRVGIHVGDIVTAADGDVYGDGVNVASRIQAAAEPGQVWVSEDVWRQLRQRPDFRFEPRGERELKGLESPLMVYAVRLASAARDSVATVSAATGSALGLEPTAPHEHSVAVLPFTNMSASEENEYFSDGITEEILMVLSKVQSLKVISRTSVMRFKGTNLGVAQIAKELGVAHIVEGSVRRAGNRVRITAQLIDARSDRHLWAEAYDRDLEDIFAIQSDVAQAIVRSLEAALTPAERERLASHPTDDPKAYEAYLEARHLIARRTEAALRQAIERLDQAVGADPGFAVAWAARAEAYALLYFYSSTPVTEALPEARQSARRALDLDPGLGEAHAALGLTAQMDFAWEEAERELRKALELSPGYAMAYHWYASLLTTRGRFDEAMKVAERALELDPLSIPIHMGYGTMLSAAGRDEEAEAMYRQGHGVGPRPCRDPGESRCPLRAAGPVRGGASEAPDDREPRPGEIPSRDRGRDARRLAVGGRGRVLASEGRRDPAVGRDRIPAFRSSRGAGSAGAGRRGLRDPGTTGGGQGSQHIPDQARAAARAVALPTLDIVRSSSGSG